MLETVGPCRRCRALLVLLVHIFVVDLQGLLSGAFNPPKLPTPSQLPPSLPSFLHGRRNRKEKKHVGTSSASRRLEFHQRKAWTSGDAASAAEDDGDAAKSSIIVEYDDFLPSPNPEYVATDIVEVCMKALLEGKGGSGLEVCFEFSSDRCRVRSINNIVLTDNLRMRVFSPSSASLLVGCLGCTWWFTGTFQAIRHQSRVRISRQLRWLEYPVGWTDHQRHRDAWRNADDLDGGGQSRRGTPKIPLDAPEGTQTTAAKLLAHPRGHLHKERIPDDRMTTE